MSLPIYTTVEDVQVVCGYLATKSIGASIDEMKAVIESKHIEGRKLSALKYFGLIEEGGKGLKVTDLGRALAKEGDTSFVEALGHVIRIIPPYLAIIERAVHRHEQSITSVDIAAHWVDHFPDQVSSSERTLNDQVLCFLRIAEGAGLGSLTIGRRGALTRFVFSEATISEYVGRSIVSSEETQHHPEMLAQSPDEETPPPTPSPVESEELGQAIFIAHGKNKKPLEQLKSILDQFKIPYKVAIDEPNLGRPIGTKVRDIMRSCNCAILIFTADEQFNDLKGNIVFRPSENVVYELGAAGFLYDKRIVIMKEERVEFPSNFSDLGYILFSTDKLSEKTMDILKELIGFGIVRITT